MNDKRVSSNLLKHATSFFFTNFPEHFGEEDLWRVFTNWGQVREVFIPPKRDKLGNRFGFVRFIGVDNPSRLEGNLNTNWFGNLKLKVNNPRFGRGVNRVGGRVENKRNIDSSFIKKKGGSTLQMW